MRWLVVLVFLVLVVMLLRALWLRFGRGGGGLAGPPSTGQGTPYGQGQWQEALQQAVERLRPVYPDLSEAQLVERLQYHVAQKGGSLVQAAEALARAVPAPPAEPDDDPEAD